MKRKKRSTKTNDGKKKLQAYSLQHKIIQELGGRCSKCGISDIRVLCLHHIIPEWKTHKSIYHDLKINHAEHNLSCLCANCHRITHHELNAERKGKDKANYKSYQSFPEEITKIKEAEEKGFISEIFQETY
jgi:hypothetical protein